MEQNSIKKNCFFYTLLILSNIGYPLIVSPYISRIFFIEQIGIMNYAGAFSGWFITILGLGIPIYGIREVAKVKNDKEKLNKVFSRILTVHIISMIFISLVYIIIIFYFSYFLLNKEIYLIYLVNIILSAFNIEWFYIGMEKYKYITTRNITIKLISLLLIFLLIKSNQNFIEYTIIIVLGTSMNSIFNILHSRKYVVLKLDVRDFFKEIKKVKYFYFQTIVGSVYSLLDQLLLGSIRGVRELAYYSRSKQILFLLSSLILSFVRTLLPKVSNLYISDIEEYRKKVDTAFDITMLYSFPCAVGLMLLSKNIMFILGGEMFLPAAGSFSILSLLIILSSVAVFFDNQISIPSGKEKITFYGNITVSVVCLSLNLVLIPIYGVKGASISLVLGEMSGNIVQWMNIKRNKLYMGFYNKRINYYIISSLIMGAVIFIIKKINLGVFLETIISVVVGLITYFFCVIKIFKINREEVAIIKKILGMIVRKNKEL